MLIFEISSLNVLIGVLLYKTVVSASPITYQRHMRGTIAAFYTTGMTAVLMGFVLEPLDAYYNAMNL